MTASSATMLQRNIKFDTMNDLRFVAIIARKNIGFLLTALCFGPSGSNDDCNLRKN